jgi:hypothetical protein
LSDIFGWKPQTTTSSIFHAPIWVREMDAAQGAIDPEAEIDLGSVRWLIKPPQYYWQPRRTLQPIYGLHTPPLGRAFYGGWGVVHGTASRKLEMSSVGPGTVKSVYRQFGNLKTS